MISGLLDFDPTNTKSLEQWALWHHQDHIEIKQVIQTALGLNLTIYDLYPLDLHKLEDWSLRHQSAHNEMNSASGLSGQDLQEVNFLDRQQRLDWHEQHFSEHNAQRIKYGI